MKLLILWLVISFGLAPFVGKCLAYRPTIEAFSTLPEYTGGILVIGDSIVEYLPEDLLPIRITNRGVSQWRLDDITANIDTVVRGTPDVIMISAGTNDILHGEATVRVVREYRALLETIISRLPHTTVCCASITPMRNRWYTAVARKVNVEIEAMAGEYGATYIDTYTPLIDPVRAVIKPEYTSDGVHLTSAGYLVWAEIVGKQLEAKYGDRLQVE